MGLGYDVLIALFVLGMTVRGWKRGALRQIGLLAVYLVAYGLARVFYPYVEIPFMESTGLPAYVSSIGVFIAIFGAFSAIGKIMVRMSLKNVMLRHGPLSFANQSVGAISGLFIALLFVFMLTGLLWQLENAKNVDLLGESKVSTWLRGSDDFQDILKLSTVVKLSLMVSSQTQEELDKDERYKSLLALPGGEVLKSKAFLEAARDNKLWELMQQKELLRYMGQKEVVDTLSALSWTP